MLAKKIYSFDPYQTENKFDSFFKNKINQLTKYHYKKSPKYRKILKHLKYKGKDLEIINLPFIPVNLFKFEDLISVKKQSIIKTLMSSGTSSSLPSKIYLDKINSINQVRVLSNIVKTILGPSRLPMLIVDKNPNKINRNKFNARIAAINGFSIFGKNHTYLLNENGEINYPTLNKFLKKFSKKIFFVFGFTSFIYEKLINDLNLKKIKFDFKNAILLHGGGWKKMQDIQISNAVFKKNLTKKIKLQNIYNYYGLVEQTGSIFIECKHCSTFKTSIFSDILIRDKNFNIVRDGHTGLIQILSLLPTSYPGHNILTEDIGKIVNTSCRVCRKLKGKNFVVYGRSKKSEIRGCSDI